jgi:hypothetical protein
MDLSIGEITFAVLMTAQFGAVVALHRDRAKERLTGGFDEIGSAGSRGPVSANSDRLLRLSDRASFELEYATRL